MLQTEQEFIRVLRSRLEDTLPADELNDIVSDYSEHFQNGMADGRSEDDLFRSLGSPEDIAREIRATHLVKKAEDVTSCKNILHAVLATIGLGLFNLVFVLVPFIVFTILLVVIFIIGAVFTVSGPVALVFAVLQMLGVPAFAIWLSPAAGIFISIGITTSGLLLMIGDYYLARFFYRAGIRYLKWNIGVIRGTESIA